MKIAIVQQNYRVGDVAGNLEKIITAAAELKRTHSELGVVVFGQDALTGTPLLGLAGSEVFQRNISDARATLERFGKEQQIRLVLEDVEWGEVKICCAADHFRHGAPEANLERLQNEVASSGKPVVWVNPVGAQTDTIFYGGSVLCRINGETGRPVCLCLPLFEEGMAVVDLASDPVMESAVWGDRMEQLRGALVLGIRDYFAKTGVREACIALSGGIDSALVLALAVEALGPEHIKVLMLPSDYSTGHSVEDSEEMLRRVGIPRENYELISIAPTFRVAVESLHPVLSRASNPVSGGLAEENMQARIRCMMTMALSNAQGALMLNTSNKSEAAVGYGTLYGDTSGAISVIGDLYKEDVYALSRYLNQRAAETGREAPIPEHIIQKAPSAELRHDQKDSDSLPDYPLLDAILLRLIEGGQSSAEIIEAGYDRDTVQRVCRMVLSGDFKRFQLPPALRVSGCTFGVEWVWPITAVKKV